TAASISPDSSSAIMLRRGMWFASQYDGRARFLRRAPGEADGHTALSALSAIRRVRPRMGGADEEAPASPARRRARSRPLRQGAILYGATRRSRHVQEPPLPQTLRGGRGAVRRLPRLALNSCG